MAEVFGGAHPRALATKGGTLAAATVLAGAGLLGVAAVGPELPGSPFAAVQHETALTAFPTFAQSLQTLLDDFGMGDLNAVLGGFGTGAFTIDTTVADFLAAMNPNGDTLNGVAEIFGLSLSEPLYSANAAVDSILGTGSLFLVDGVPIGNIELGDLVDVFLGDGASEHSLQDLANAVGLGSLLSQWGSAINLLGLENLNVMNCTLGICSHPDLATSSHLDDWLTGILGVNTRDVSWTSGVWPIQQEHHLDAYTLGEYLHTLPVSATDSTTMDQATLGLLFGMPPGQPWDEYVSLFPFGGTFLDPSGETWGEQTVGTLLSSFLPDDSTLVIDGDTPITAILEAFGLLW